MSGFVWRSIDESPPSESGHIWISRPGSNQVKIAYWSMTATDPYYHETCPAIVWAHGWLGTDEPTHWCAAERPPSSPPLGESDAS